MPLIAANQPANADQEKRAERGISGGYLEKKIFNINKRYQFLAYVLLFLSDSTRLGSARSLLSICILKQSGNGAGNSVFNYSSHSFHSIHSYMSE